jgi:hypothetical protein
MPESSKQQKTSEGKSFLKPNKYAKIGRVFCNLSLDNKVTSIKISSYK